MAPPGPSFPAPDEAFSTFSSYGLEELTPERRGSIASGLPPPADVCLSSGSCCPPFFTPSPTKIPPSRPWRREGGKEGGKEKDPQGERVISFFLSFGAAGTFAKK